MKRLFIALALIAIIISACVFEQVKLDRVYDGICSDLDEISEYAKNDDYRGAYDACCRLDVYFQKEYKCLSLMQYNHKLNEFHVSVHELKGLAQDGDKALQGKLLATKIQAEQIKNNQKIRFENIL